MAKTNKISFSQRFEKTVIEFQKKEKIKKSDLERRAAALYSHLYKEVTERFQKSPEPELGGETEIDL
jgi:hypothetical protein